MIVDVRIVFIHHAEPIAMLELKLERVRIHDSRSHWEIVNQKMNEVLVSYSLENLL